MRRSLFLILILVLSFASFAPTVSAQLGQDDFCSDALEIEYGDSGEGTVSNASVAIGFCFDGKAGDEVTVSLFVVSGNLDPIVLISDPTLEEIYVNSLDEGASGRSMEFNLTLPEDGRYLIAVSRVGFEEGTTSGDFEVTLSEGSGTGTSGTGLGNTPEDDLIFNITCTVEGQTTQEIRGGVQFSFINVNPRFFIHSNGFRYRWV